MKFRAWQETQQVRSIMTGEGPLAAHKGDVVIVAVVERWDDAAAAMAAIARMTAVPKVEET